MAVFRFSLEQVLVYRTRLEDEAKSMFAKIQSEVLTEKENQQKIATEIDIQEALLVTTDAADNGKRWLIDSYIKALRMDMKEVAKRLHRLEQQLEVARQKLALCSKDKMIMEKLKEKHERAFKFEELQKEQREFDEIATIRFQAQTN